MIKSELLLYTKILNRIKLRSNVKKRVEIVIISFLSNTNNNI